MPVSSAMPEPAVAEAVVSAKMASVMASTDEKSRMAVITAVAMMNTAGQNCDKPNRKQRFDHPLFTQVRRWWTRMSVAESMIVHTSCFFRVHLI